MTNALTVSWDGKTSYHLLPFSTVNLPVVRIANALIGGQPVGREGRFISPSNLVTCFEMTFAESRVGTW